MPRPTNQEFYTKKDGSNVKVQEVFIDPFLASVLRPHQVEGVQFLYESIMGFKEKGTGAILADEM